MCCGLLRGLLELGDPEVENLELRLALPVQREKEVLRLEVSMEDAGAVRLLQRVAQLFEEIRDERRGQGTAPDPRVEPLSFQQLHGNEGDLQRLVDPRIEDVDDVLALADARGDARLADEELADRVIANELRLDELERDPAVGLRVDRRPHDRHPALADHRFEPVARRHHEPALGHCAHHRCRRDIRSF